MQSISTGGLTTGQWYYRENRDKNREAVKRYQAIHREERGAWNRRYYFKNRTSKMIYRPIIYTTKNRKEYWDKRKIRDFDPFKYIDDERFDNNKRDCELYYNLITGRIKLEDYKRIMAANYDIGHDYCRLTGKNKAHYCGVTNGFGNNL